MGLEGHNRWMEYPDEIEPGSLIQIGDRLIVVAKVGYLGGGIHAIFFDLELDKDHAQKVLHVHAHDQIETYTKQP